MPLIMPNFIALGSTMHDVCFIFVFLPSFYNCITHRTPMTVGLSMIVYVLYSHSLLYWVASVNLY